MVRIRLSRVGSKKNPIWRVVVADKRRARDARIIENVGTYNAQTEPSTITLKQDRLEHWIGKGAQPTDQVLNLMEIEQIGPDGRPVGAA